MRYLIGIDLGTTNCSLAFVDTEHPSLPVQIFAIPQLTAPGRVDSLLSLPSFCYLPALDEWPPGSMALPWKETPSRFVGQFAKIQGARVPTRLVQSAKSWLSNVAAHRRDKILPLEATDITQRLSPVEASADYLMHLRDAWNSTMAKRSPENELEEQEVVLTVPASFNEVARTLTVEAARQAGFLHITLLEEPQAAFYSWISQHEEEWKTLFKPGETLLVCDVGGGTTDFSLIEIQQEEGKLAFQRMAVGNHLLLGGDNIDAALAHALEGKLEQRGHPPLESSQWLQLQAEARRAKETLLQSKVKPNEEYSIVLQGSGSAVVKGSVAVSITQKEMEDLLLKGFFGRYPLRDALKLQESRGFRTLGLPYEDDPSITKHLAHFLHQSHALDKGKGVDYILFNGGTLTPEIFQHAIEEALLLWFPHTPLRRLISPSLDLAVARGAAYYGKVRRGFGVAIGGGLPRTYYLKIDVKDPSGHIKTQALTLLSRGSEEGKVFQLDQHFALRPNRPVAFHLLTSHVRLNDREGDLVHIDPVEMQSLAPIQTLLRFGKKQRDDADEATPLLVRLGIRLTAVGTVELWLESQTTPHQWQMEFQVSSMQVRSMQTAQEARDEIFEKGYLEGAKKTIEKLFHPEISFQPSQIMECLESEIGSRRREWGPTVLRELWNPLLKMASHRKLSGEHEERWWHLAGFFLRPGFGFPLDDVRLKELWKIILWELKTPKRSACLIQMCICFRRLAGGFNKGQQVQLLSDVIGTVVDKTTGKIDIKRKGDLYLYSEKVRALAALERLELPFKIRLGEALVDRLLHHSPTMADYWALGRVGARHLMHGSLGQVVPKEVVVRWLDRLLPHQPSPENQESMRFLLRQLARKTGHRELNLPDVMIQKILAAYPHEALKEGLLQERGLTQNEQEQIFGDQLPAGLVLVLKD